MASPDGVRSGRESMVATTPTAAATVTTRQPPARARGSEASHDSQLAPEAQVAAEGAFHKAVQAESQGVWQDAIRYYEEAIALNPTLREAYNNLGHLYARQKQLPAAVEQFQAALGVEPNYAVAHNNLGSTYLMLGREAMAIQEFLAAIRIDAHYVTPYYNLGSLYARRGDVDQAISFLTKAMAMEPAVLTWVRQDPDFDRIRSSPAFQRLHIRVR